MDDRVKIYVGLISIGIGLLLIPATYKYVILPLRYSKFQQWMPLIEKWSKYYGVDPRFIVSIISQESGGNTNAISSVGAIGLMQIMPSTASSVCGVTREQLFNPESNISCGVKYISDTYKKYGDYRKVAAVYYSGKPDYLSSIGKPPVYTYVANVMSKFNEIAMGV